MSSEIEIVAMQVMADFDPVESRGAVEQSKNIVADVVDGKAGSKSDEERLMMEAVPFEYPTIADTVLSSPIPAFSSIAISRIGRSSFIVRTRLPSLPSNPSCHSRIVPSNEAEMILVAVEDSDTI